MPKPGAGSTSLDDMSRSELQALAKEHGVKANLKNGDLISKLQELGIGGESPQSESATEEQLDIKEASPAKTPKAQKQNRKSVQPAAKVEEKQAGGSSSREELQKLGRAKLQAMAKANGLKANAKTDDLIDALMNLQGEQQDEPAAPEEDVAAPVSVEKKPQASSRRSSTGTTKRLSKAPKEPKVAPEEPSERKKEQEEEQEEEVEIPITTKSPRRSSVNMLREARCKRRSSAASRISVGSYAPPSHPAAAAHLLSPSSAKASPARKSPAVSLARKSPAAAAAVADASSMSAMCGKKRRRSEATAEPTPAEEDRQAKKKRVGKSRKSEAPGTPKARKSFLADTAASSLRATPKAADTRKSISRKSIGAKTPVGGRSMPWESKVLIAAPGIAAAITASVDSSKKPALFDRKDMFTKKRGEALKGNRESIKLSMAANRQQSSAAPVSRLAQLKGSGKPSLLAATAKLSAAANGGFSFSAPPTASPSKSPQAAVNKKSPKPGAAKLAGGASYKPKTGKLPEFNYDARSIFLKKPSPAKAHFTFGASSDVHKESAAAAAPKPKGYKPYVGKYQYKENMGSNTSPKKYHSSFKAALPAAARGTPGRSQAAEASSKSTKSAVKRKSSSDNLVLPDCPTVLM